MLKRYINLLFAIGGLISPICASANNDATSISTYQYWLDDDITSMVTKPYQGKEINLSFKQTDYSQGVHYIHFRIKTNTGLWSKAQTFFSTYQKRRIQKKKANNPLLDIDMEQTDCHIPSK